MTPSTPQAHPAVSPEAMALLADGIPAALPSRERRVLLLEEALDSLERFLPCLELRLGQLLEPLLREGYRHLSYVTPAVFCREELGFSATTARDLVRLAQGLPARSVLLQAFLECRLPRSHALELLKIDPEDDGDWVRRIPDLSVPELRKALKPLLVAAGAEATGGDRVVRTYELDADAYSTWLAVTELARRREGRDLGGDVVLEQILAELAASQSLSEAPEDRCLLEREPAWGAESSAPEPACPPPFQRDPAWPGAAHRAGGDAVGDGRTATLAPTHETPGSDASLPPLLLEEVPRSPRKLTRMVLRCLCLREQADLHRARVLRRIQQGRLSRDLGHASFRSWLGSRGLCASSVFQATARDERLERQPRIRRALLEGVLTATKADLLLRLPAHADLVSWIAYAQACTCRRLEEAVEAALVLAARFPAAWARRGRTAPGEAETLQEFRQQAGLVPLEAALDDLARAFQEAGSAPAAGTPGNATSGTPEVQTSAPASALRRVPTAAGVQASAQGSAPAAGATPTCEGVQASAQGAVPPPGTIRLRLSLPKSVERLLVAAEEDLRRDAGRHLAPEECLHVLLLMFLRLVGQEEHPELRGLRRMAFARTGYRCEVPGCSGRTNLHLHHLVRRSQGGRDELANLAVLCASHHLRHVHGGTMRVEGEEPESRIWDLGLDEDGMPWRTYVDERLVDGAALFHEQEAEQDGKRAAADADGAAGRTSESGWSAPPTGDDRVCESSLPYGSRPAA